MTCVGANNRDRTDDILLGRQKLYQLSYIRKIIYLLQNWWILMDSNHLVYPEGTDLQSAAGRGRSRVSIKLILAVMVGVEPT
ncbi:hypothetical protein PHG25p112nc [Aeromonas phage 25]|uniref:Uncharacterized protein n=1 Tax=Aeromonas phage 25 TaxID=2911441 RepID=Q19CQ5_9CAUD|nr:hypothetical protein PHG25p112nc [Aeromonas phage 25]ABF72670.1 hypothetical protein PHG25p112nc [Aeromonas phage 25]